MRQKKPQNQSSPVTDLYFADPCLLGSDGENSETSERVLLEYLRDHVY